MFLLDDILNKVTFPFQSYLIDIYVAFFTYKKN